MKTNRTTRYGPEPKGPAGMKPSTFATGRLLALVLAGALLASCTAHGQQPSMRGLPAELSELPYWKVFRNHSSHSEQFFKSLVFGRVFVYGYWKAPGSVRAEFIREDGRRFLCWWNSSKRKYELDWASVDIEAHSVGAQKITLHRHGKHYVRLFYEPTSGTLYTESLKPHSDPRKHQRKLSRSGWVQDKWPRVVADGCPDFVALSGIGINEKQTSSKIDELRRQDPDAPIRNFPGSQLTAPGRTGLAASGGKPTTTKAEVEAFLDAQEGNILRWNTYGWVWVRSGDREEVWRIQDERASERFFDVARAEDGSRLAVRFPTRDMVYMVGYPFPFLPTGHRHPAFQLTDELLARPYPRSLPFMGEAYADKRFVFHPKGKFSVVDEAGNLDQGPHFAGTWRWTRQALEMTVRNDPTGFRLVHWRTLAHQLGMKPVVWTQHTPDRID